MLLTEWADLQIDPPQGCAFAGVFPGGRPYRWVYQRPAFAVDQKHLPNELIRAFRSSAARARS